MKNELFGGQNSQQYNALYDALIECGKDYKHTTDPYAVYAWLAETPKTSLTVELVDKLNEMGFVISKK